MWTRIEIAAAIVCGLGVACPAVGAPRTFVASYGVDSNPCVVTAPCRTFTAALALTSVGGEIVALDSAGYGTVVIGQSVSIVSAPGAYAGISVFSGNGVEVTVPNVVVLLQGITINGQGGNQGIYLSGSGIRLEAVEVAVTGMTGKFSSGIGVHGGARAEVKRGLLRRNGAWGADADSGSTLVLDEVTIIDNGTGVSIRGGAWGTITRSTLARNTSAGVVADATGGVTTQVSVDASRIVENGAWGVAAYSSGAGNETRGSVANSTIARNQGGVLGQVAFGSTTIVSVKDNVIEGHYAGVAPGWGVRAECDATSLNAIVNASGNLVTSNVVGFTAAMDAGGPPAWWCPFRTIGDNMVRDNTVADIAAVVTKAAGD
jgi:hypothetical protein